MKELSIEQKAKAYDEALKRAKIWQKHLNEVGDKDFADELNYIFSELRESEDEKTRNFLIKQANSVLDSMTDDDEEVPAWKSALAWLEKQKSKFNPYSGVSVSHDNGVDIFFDKKLIKHVSGENQSEQKKSVDDLTQQEAMDIAVAKCFEQGEQKSDIGIEIPFGAKDSELQEATYLIPEGFHAEIKDDEVLIKKGKQKPTKWNEEDERMYSMVFEEYKNRQYYSHPSLKSRDINGEILGWLKSIKQRIGG